jgi:hypothetical protein
MNELTELHLQALELANGVPGTPAGLTRLSQEVGDDLARWAVRQWQLRSKAVSKFRNARNMLFVREALEQATNEQVAAYHASKFTGGELVADFTTGIGADLIALARRGPVIGYELDPERALYAAFNLKAAGLSGEVRREDSLTSRIGVNYAFADPARRVDGRRTLDLADFEPNVELLASHFARLRLGGIKLSPMLSDSDLQRLAPSIEFVSFGRECREALLWSGEAAPTGTFAVHVESNERIPASNPTAFAEQPLQFFFEADPAAIRAHALGNFNARLLGDSNGYLTSDEELASPWLRTYRVLWSANADVRKTRAELKRLQAKPILKQRAGIDLPALARQLGRHGDRNVYVAVWQVGKSLKHTILEEVQS